LSAFFPRGIFLSVKQDSELVPTEKAYSFPHFGAFKKHRGSFSLIVSAAEKIVKISKKLKQKKNESGRYAFASSLPRRFPA